MGDNNWYLDAQLIGEICDHLKKSKCITGNAYFTNQTNRLTITAMEDRLQISEGMDQSHMVVIPILTLPKHYQTQLRLARLAAIKEKNQ